MLSKALDYIKVNNMIEEGDRIVAGVSGGADSVCLLHVLKELCEELSAALLVVHINHGIRGAEAARDEAFVKELCGHMGIEFLSYSYDVKSLAVEQGLSEEEAGRKVRYDTFIETCKIKKCNKIAIAHNKNDHAETVLFHLFRGSGMRGLCGIEPKRLITSDAGEIMIIRPLLCIERREIEEYLRSIEAAFQTDSTNLTEDYTRNKIRNRILTYAVEEINSGAVSNINEAAAQLKEAMEYIETNVQSRYQKLVQKTAFLYRIPAEEMKKEPRVIQRGILMKVMENLAGKRKDLEAKHVEAIFSLLDKQVGRYIHLPYQMIAEREYEAIALYIDGVENHSITERESLPGVKLQIPGRVILPQYFKMIETELIEYKKDMSIPKSSCMKWFDYDKIVNAVEIRTRKKGDYLQINDSGGTKKLKDYFIDQKIPRRLRDTKLLVMDGNHVMWIPFEGDRISEKYKVDETTKNILLMKLLDLEEDKDDR